MVGRNQGFKDQDQGGSGLVGIRGFKYSGHGAIRWLERPGARNETGAWHGNSPCGAADGYKA